jgi:DNA topoisomerase-1
MKKSLVIVESPAKARTLTQILGNNYIIKASLGHVRDLPKKVLGIDVDKDFMPKYSILPEKKKLIKELKEIINDINAIYLATDPDREGEAISWHLIEAIKLENNKIPINRVVFHEITEDAVKQAFTKPRSIDMDLVNAQQARRLLDRLVGYKLSPFLWKKVVRGLSAGRVQSATLRIIVDREREIENFISVEFWNIEVELAKYNSENNSRTFRAMLVGSINGKKLIVSNKLYSDEVCNLLKDSTFNVNSVQNKHVKKQPAAPFTTSTLQQEAWRRFHFTAKRTMSIAQQLYEGIQLGDEGTVGVITYMRTDSTHLAPIAISETRDLILQKFGETFLPPKPRIFTKKSKFSQEAHEAIRPTKVARLPEVIRQFLKPEQNKLYELIWKRMVACQMAEAIYNALTVDIHSLHKTTKVTYLLRANSSKLSFPGFMTLYIEIKDDEEKDETIDIPELERDENLKFVNIYPKQNFTEPPPRYNEATLIKSLEQKGIGRPSTYAPIISTIQDREYVSKDNGRFKPEEIGFIVSDLLVKNFPDIVDLNFTAKIENDLDSIATGKKEWISVLRDFYIPFADILEKAAKTVEKVRTDKETDQKCSDCGKPMLIKTGRFGKFLACSGYPECKKTMPLMVKTGILCPECGESHHGELVQRRGKRGTVFYGCNRYPECRFTIRQKPAPQPCPMCNKLLVIYRNGMVRCTSCNFKGDLPSSEKTSGE